MAGSKIIDLNYLQSMIDRTEIGVKINSYEVRYLIFYTNYVLLIVFQTTLGSKRGDNYTSMLYRIKLYGDNGWTKSLIYKCLPDNKQARSTYKSEILFNNEVTFYMKSLTALMEYQVSRYSVEDPCYI